MMTRANLEFDRSKAEAEAELSSESSSIGRPDDDDSDDNDDDEVGSSLSFGSLEDSLPIKRGLSKYYAGKSKSFGNLGEVRSIRELPKSDNPFNKRRRTLLAYNLHTNLMMNMKEKKKSAFYCHSNHISMPLLPLAEDDDDQDQQQRQQQQQPDDGSQQQLLQQPHLHIGFRHFVNGNASTSTSNISDDEDSEDDDDDTL